MRMSPDFLLGIKKWFAELFTLKAVSIKKNSFYIKALGKRTLPLFLKKDFLLNASDLVFFQIP
jgi:hypothetical protein